MKPENELPKDKKKTTGGKRKKTSSTDTKSPKKSKKTEDTSTNTDTMITEKDSEQNGFAILGSEMDRFITFALDRGKCNEMSSAETITRNLIIINKNVCTIAQFFEHQKKWLDQFNIEETEEDQHCEVCFKHCPPFSILKGMAVQPLT